MSLLKKLFGGAKKNRSNSAADFWRWFGQHEKEYRDISKNPMEKREQLLDTLLTRLNPYNPYLKCLLGYNNNRNELIITADGDIALFSKVEKLIETAPVLDSWNFIAHKPACGFDINIEMHGEKFDDTTLHFYPVTEPNMPDEISLVFTHPNFKESESKDFDTACSIYLENVLGELAVSTDIDVFEMGPETNTEELIPIKKLPEYLNWRKKEFVEKYEHLQAEEMDDEYAVLEGETQGRKPIIVVIRSAGQYYGSKPAFPWFLQVKMGFKGNENGFPTNPQLEETRNIQDAVTALLGQVADFHELGAKTFDHNRSLFYYLHDYPLASDALHDYFDTLKTGMDIAFFITKDKYWQEMEDFYRS